MRQLGVRTIRWLILSLASRVVRRARVFHVPLYSNNLCCVRRNCCRFVLVFSVGQDGGGGAFEDAVHRAALPVQVPRVSDDRGVSGPATAVGHSAFSCGCSLECAYGVSGSKKLHFPAGVFLGPSVFRVFFFKCRSTTVGTCRTVLTLRRFVSRVVLLDGSMISHK